MRESAITNREKNIAQQIFQLEKKFEQLQTENSRLKSDLTTTLAECDKMTTSLYRQEEEKSKLQWALEDERQQRIHSEDALRRELQTLQLDLTLCKENAEKRVANVQNELDSVRETIISLRSLIALR